MLPPSILDKVNADFTTEKVAIKIIDKSKLDERTRKLLSQEILCMERLDHPNIIKLYEVVDLLPRMHVVMEYAPGGELFDHIIKNGHYSEDDARPVFAQVVSAIQHMVCITVAVYILVNNTYNT